MFVASGCDAADLGAEAAAIYRSVREINCRTASALSPSESGSCITALIASATQRNDWPSGAGDDVVRQRHEVAAIIAGEPGR